jgi:purine nucleoside phosphorylase
MSNIFDGILNHGSSEPFDLAVEAAAVIAEKTGVASHDIALTLGSGWAKAADLMGETVASIPAASIPGFLPPAVEGHVASIRSILLPTGKHALVLGARTHYYEGHGVRRVVHGVRTAAATGVKTMILTNGAGGIRETIKPGSPVLISDRSKVRPLLTSPTFIRSACATSPAVLTAPSKTAFMCSFVARTMRPLLKFKWLRPLVVMWLACQPRSRQSLRARLAWRSWAFRS